MNRVGIVLTNMELVNTKFPQGKIGQLYKDAMTATFLNVMEVSQHDGSFLCLVDDGKTGAFMWHLEKTDTSKYFSNEEINQMLIACGRFDLTITNNGLLQIVNVLKLEK